MSFRLEVRREEVRENAQRVEHIREESRKPARVSEPAKRISSQETLRVSPLADLRLRAQGTKLLDAHGREVLLRGVNAGGRSKWSPFFPFPFAESGRKDQRKAPPFEVACAKYLDGARSLGHNFLRVPFTWEAIEPTRGVYDETYLARLEKFVDLASARGLRVVLDSHQDLFARQYGGDGFPKWTLSEPNAKQPWYGHVLWGLGYQFDGKVRRDFTRFWQNQDGLQDDYERMWRMLAARFKDKTNVVGFEIINEPDAGTLPQKEWARDRLTAFHERIGSAVREVAPHTLVVFGASGRDGMRATTDTDKPLGDGWVFAPHYYDMTRMTFALSGLGAVNSVLGSVDAKTPIEKWRERGDAWNTPVIIGEFGFPRKSGLATANLSATYDALDAHLLSGAVWEYSTAQDDWNNEGLSIVGPGGTPTQLSAVATRAYPAAIAGTLREFSWSGSEGRLVFDARPSAMSEIALPRALVGDRKISVSVHGEPNVRWKYEDEKLLIDADTPGRVQIHFSLH